MSGQVTATNKTGGYEITGTTSGDKRGLDVREIEFNVIIDEPFDNTIYIGKAPAGTATSAAGWSIVKIHTSGQVTTKLAADGNFNFDNIWDNRASLSYS